MEEQNTLQGIDARQIKRTALFISVLYYTHTILYWLYDSYLIAFSDGDVNEDLLANFYPHLVQNESYIIWLRFQIFFFDFLFVIFCPLLDIVPALVYYHSAKIVEGIKFDILLEIASNNPPASPSDSSKSGIIYSLWSRFEAITVMVRRADNIFGPLVILCHGYFFFTFVVSFTFILKQL